MPPSFAHEHRNIGDLMIGEVRIQNFRLFESLTIPDCRRVNVVVGDNGAGKTALLEAIFLALGSSTELGVRYRQFRGLAGSFNGPPRRIEEAIWRDFFYMGEWQQREILIETKGDGEESRSVRVTRTPSQLFIPLANEAGRPIEETTTAPLKFIWRDSLKHEYTAVPTISAGGINFAGTEEDLPDFFYFASGVQVPSVENAARFSELSQAGKLRHFVEVFTREYKLIKDMRIEVIAGSPVIFATLHDSGFSLPLANISGGINRIVGVMLGVASRPRTVVLADELDDGIYYKHQAEVWRALLSMIRENESQLFATTHSIEWLEALVEAAGRDSSDICIWRLERHRGAPVLVELKGRQAILGIKSGGVR